MGLPIQLIYIIYWTKKVKDHDLDIKN